MPDILTEVEQYELRKLLLPRFDCTTKGRVVSREVCLGCELVRGKCTVVMDYLPTRMLAKTRDPEVNGETSPSGRRNATRYEEKADEHLTEDVPFSEPPAKPIPIPPDVEALMARRPRGKNSRTAEETAGRRKARFRVNNLRRHVREAAAKGDQAKFDKAVAGLKAELESKTEPRYLSAVDIAEDTADALAFARTFPPSMAQSAAPTTPEDQPLAFCGEDGPPPGPAESHLDEATSRPEPDSREVVFRFTVARRGKWRVTVDYDYGPEIGGNAS